LPYSINPTFNFTQTPQLRPEARALRRVHGCTKRERVLLRVERELLQIPCGHKEPAEVFVTAFPNLTRRKMYQDAINPVPHKELRSGCSSFT
jgi:hypothetical protein